MPAPYDAATVANRFIELAEQQNRRLTPMQLIKLTYIAHGFSLAINRRPLIKQPVEAWRYGPVIPSLYRRMKSFGADGVDRPLSPVFGGLRSEQIDPSDLAIIDEVFAKYGKLTGVQLSYLTHKRGTPWERTYRPDEYGTEMDNAVIGQHYDTLLAAG
jgi:uncharacterized phage-associated protein